VEQLVCGIFANGFARAGGPERHRAAPHAHRRRRRVGSIRNDPHGRGESKRARRSTNGRSRWLNQGPQQPADHEEGCRRLQEARSRQSPALDQVTKFHPRGQLLCPMFFTISRDRLSLIRNVCLPWGRLTTAPCGPSQACQAVPCERQLPVILLYLPSAALPILLHCAKPLLPHIVTRKTNAGSLPPAGTGHL